MYNFTMIIIALENIRSLYNIGAIIRSCEFFGIKEVAFIGYTGHDSYSPNGIHPKIQKTALSAIDQIKITRFESIKELKDKYPKAKLVCIENNVPGTKNISSFGPNYQSNTLIILFGNEVEGIRPETLELADGIYEIQRIGKHQSLNVATTVGIVLFTVTKIYLSS